MEGAGGPGQQRRSGLGKHVSQDGCNGQVSPSSWPAFLPPALTWLPKHPAFPSGAAVLFALLSG